MPETFNYQRYLASREWAVLKEAVRRRSGGKCERWLSGKIIYDPAWLQLRSSRAELEVELCALLADVALGTITYDGERGLAFIRVIAEMEAVCYRSERASWQRATRREDAA